MTLFEQAMATHKRTHDARDLLDEMTNAEAALEEALDACDRGLPQWATVIEAWRRLKAARAALLD